MALFKKRKDIEQKITIAMQSVFSTKKDRKMAIHVAAAAGAGIVAILPVGIDAWALRIAEIVMVICIASSYGEKLTKSAAKGLLLSSFAQLAGETAAFAALEALEVGKVASLPTGAGPIAAYAAKAGIAITLIETVGNLVIAFYEKPNGIGSIACKTAEVIGAAADIARIKEALAGLIETISGGSEAAEAGLEGTGGNNEISFKGTPKLSEPERRNAVRQARAAKTKLEGAKKIAIKENNPQKVAKINKAIQQVGYLESDITLNRSTIASTLYDAERAIKMI